jgi:hypothetical protein
VAAKPDREEIACFVEGQLGGHLVVAAVAVGDKALAAFVGPFDRPAQRFRGVEKGQVFGIDL